PDIRATPQHEHVEVGHEYQRHDHSGEPIVVAGQRCRRVRVAVPRRADDVAARQRAAGVLGVVALEPGARQPGLDAPPLGTVAGRTGPLVGRGPGKRVVPPFAGDQVRAHQDPTVHDDPAPYTRTQDDAEHDVRARGGAVGGLGERDAVRVVHEPYGTVEP